MPVEGPEEQAQQQPEQQLRTVPVGHAPRHEQEQRAPHTVPIEDAAGTATREEQQVEEQREEAMPASPASPTATPSELAEAVVEAAAPVSTDKGKAPASPGQAADLERQEAARRAAERIAAGHASDSDWEEADGSVEDCQLAE